MATTFQDIAQDVLEMLMVYAPGETISDADAERVLTVANDMLDSWSNESLTCYQEIEQSTALIAAKQQYTIGSGGDVNVTRPLRIKDGPGAAYVQDTNGNNYPLDVLPLDSWNMIGNRGAQVTANIPMVLFYDPAFPLGKLNFYPTPNQGGFTAFWDSYLQLTTFASLTTALSLPPGYSLAIKSNLAVEVKPYFKTAQLDPLIIAKASKSKANIKITNKRLNEALMDAALVARSGYAYNIFTDRTTT